MSASRSLFGGLAVGIALAFAAPAAAENALRFTGKDARAATMDPHSFALEDNQEDLGALLVEEVSPHDAVEEGEGADCATTLNELLESDYRISAVNSATGGVTGNVVHIIYTLTKR
jgi:hypothetical protein